jgi:hypothetical protein
MNLREQFLLILLDSLPPSEIVSVRDNATRIAKNLHENEELKQLIEVRTHLFTLRKSDEWSSSNTSEKCNERLLVATNNWTEESIRLCLALSLSLMAANHNLTQP